MTQNWKKLGQIYLPKASQRHPKLISHAANPLACHLQGDIFRIFYSGRDDRNRSSVGAVDINIYSRAVIYDYYAPFFEHGSENSYYSDGVSIGNCYEVNGVRYMLFMGWRNPDKQHWYGEIGRLIVSADLKLVLDDSKPLIGLDTTDPISLSYPWVTARPSGGFDMWYGSTRHWDAGNGEMLHNIQHATSEDGHIWQRNGLAVPYEIGFAQAFSRPTVALNKQGNKEMWFSYRSGSGEKYRIGHAICDKESQWKLDLENSGITVSDSGWDSEMIEYPFVFDHDGDRYMLYNGNDYGKSGFGLAVLENI